MNLVGADAFPDEPVWRVHPWDKPMRGGAMNVGKTQKNDWGLLNRWLSIRLWRTERAC